MPGPPPPVATERDELLGYLRQQRDGLRYAVYGLTDEQLRLTPTASSLTVGGLLKHAAHTEHDWVQTLRGEPPPTDQQGYTDSFVLGAGETAVSLVAGLDRVAAETAEAVAGLPSLHVRVRLPEAPWYRHHHDGVPARWILLHLVEELARHAGHADIIRESIDGATMYPLMAAAQGWPETPWLTPWRPAAPSG